MPGLLDRFQCGCAFLDLHSSDLWSSPDGARGSDCDKRAEHERPLYVLAKTRPATSTAWPGPSDSDRTADDEMRRNGDCAKASRAGIDSQTRTSLPHCTLRTPAKSNVLQHTAHFLCAAPARTGVTCRSSEQVPARGRLRSRDRPTRFGRGRHVRPHTEAFTPPVSARNCLLNSARCDAFNVLTRSYL